MLDNNTKNIGERLGAGGTHLPLIDGTTALRDAVKRPTASASRYVDMSGEGPNCVRVLFGVAGDGSMEMTGALDRAVR